MSLYYNCVLSYNYVMVAYQKTNINNNKLLKINNNQYIKKVISQNII